VFIFYTYLVLTFSISVVKPVVTTASFNPLFIVLILGILILFIVIALIVCYMYRNRGGVYLCKYDLLTNKYVP